VRPEHLGRRSKLDLAVWGDVAETAALPEPPMWREEVRPAVPGPDAQEAQRRPWRAWSRRTPARSTSNVPIHPEYVASVLDEEAADDAVFTVDNRDVQNVVGGPAI